MAAAILVSGALWFLSSGIYHLWPLAWLAPLPLLLVLPHLRIVPAALAAFSASAIGALSWLVAYGPLSVAFVFMAAVPYTIVAVGWRSIARRAHPVVASVAYPALAVSAEFVMSRVSPHGTLGSLAYSQGDLPVVLQVASVTGLWGISFLLALIPASAATAWLRRGEPHLVRSLILVGGLPLLAAVAFGVVQLADSDSLADVRVGLAASDIDTVRRLEGEGLGGDPLPIVRAFADRAAVLASRGAAVVVLPEKFAAITPEHRALAGNILAATAREHRITIVAGWYVESASERRNVAVVFGPDGRVVLEYDKQHLIPGIEWGYRAGEAIGLLGKGMGVAICKDLDFIPLGRAYGQAGVGLLLVPAWDFARDRWLHSRMAVVRGVEGRYAIARIATDGLLTVSDAHGRIVAERASDESAEVLLNATVRLGPGGSFYSRTDDWFAWVCVLVASLSCASAVVWRYAAPTLVREAVASREA
jgi:apolipoprotein N-acyltransferase